jgi:hypothetical protein
MRIRRGCIADGSGAAATDGRSGATGLRLLMFMYPAVAGTGVPSSSVEVGHRGSEPLDVTRRVGRRLHRFRCKATGAMQWSNP